MNHLNLGMLVLALVGLVGLGVGQLILWNGEDNPGCEFTRYNRLSTFAFYAFQAPAILAFLGLAVLVVINYGLELP